MYNVTNSFYMEYKSKCYHSLHRVVQAILCPNVRAFNFILQSHRKLLIIFDITIFDITILIHIMNTVIISIKLIDDEYNW